MFTYKKAPYKIFALGPKFCWAGPDDMEDIYSWHKDEVPSMMECSIFMVVHYCSSTGSFVLLPSCDQWRQEVHSVRQEVVDHSYRFAILLRYHLPMHIILQFCTGFIDDKHLKRGRPVLNTNARNYFWPRFLWDVLTILPIPQVRESSANFYLNLLVVFQDLFFWGGWESLLFN